MTNSLVPRIRYPALVWVGVAIGCGAMAALLPLKVAGGVLALAAFGMVFLVEPALALVVMLVVAPLKTLMATEGALPLPADVGQLSFALTAGVWALWRVSVRRNDPLVWPRVLVPLSVIVAGFAPSLLAASSTGAWLSEFVKWVEILVLVVIVFDLGQAGRWTWIAFGIVLAAVLQALIGLYEYFGGSGAPHLWIANFQHFRAFGTFGQPNPFSAFMGLTLPLALGLAWGYARTALPRWRAMSDRWLAPAGLALGYSAAALILLFGLLVSWGRGAWLGFAAAATVMALFAPRRRLWGVLLLIGGLAVVVALWMGNMVPLGIRLRIESTVTEYVGVRDVRGMAISDENFAIVERMAHWQAAYYMANAHPILGVGLGNYETVYPSYGVPSWPRPLGHAHNDYLNMLAETGIIGLTGYLIGWLVIGVWTLRALRVSDPLLSGLALGLLGSWTHLAIHSFVDKLYVNNLFLHIGVMLGLLAVAECTARHYDVGGHRNDIF